MLSRVHPVEFSKYEFKPSPSGSRAFLQASKGSVLSRTTSPKSFTPSPSVSAKVGFENHPNTPSNSSQSARPSASESV